MPVTAGAPIRPTAVGDADGAERDAPGPRRLTPRAVSRATIPAGVSSSPATQNNVSRPTHTRETDGVADRTLGDELAVDAEPEVREAVQMARESDMGVVPRTHEPTRQEAEMLPRCLSDVAGKGTRR